MTNYIITSEDMQKVRMALKENHEHHIAYDEHEGYAESDLQEDNLKALAILDKAQRVEVVGELKDERDALQAALAQEQTDYKSKCIELEVADRDCDKLRAEVDRLQAQTNERGALAIANGIRMERAEAELTEEQEEVATLWKQVAAMVEREIALQAERDAARQSHALKEGVRSGQIEAERDQLRAEVERMTAENSANMATCKGIIQGLEAQLAVMRYQENYTLQSRITALQAEIDNLKLRPEVQPEPLINYRHKDGTGRFHQYVKDPLPSWAMDVQPGQQAQRAERAPLSDTEISLMAHNDCSDDWDCLDCKESWLDGYVIGAKAVNSIKQ